MAEVVGSLTGAVEFTDLEIAAFPKTKWFVGSGAPPDSLGSGGDLYLDDVTGDIYQKENGSWA